MRSAFLLCLLSLPAVAQVPNALVQFPEPPELNGASALTYNRHILWNSGKTCVQRPVGAVWECFATQAEVTAANATQDAAVTSLTGRVSTLESQVATVQSAATAAQSTATAAQTATSTNASAISALSARVTTAEAAIAALQALPKRACTTATLTGLSIPLTGGLSSTQNVNLAGVPVGTTCTVAGSTRAPAGATGSPIVAAAGVVNVAFVGGGGLLSGIIAIPNGTYRICCDI